MREEPTCSATAAYLAMLVGTITRWGHNFLAINPGIAALTPNLLA